MQQNAAWPEEAVVKKPRGWDHWAFQVPKRPAVPAVQNSAWTRNPIDNFILARLEQEEQTVATEPHDRFQDAVRFRNIQSEIEDLNTEVWHQQQKQKASGS